MRLLFALAAGIGRVASVQAQVHAPAAARPAASVAITHATVIDVATGQRLADRTVLVRGTRIVRVGPTAATPLPAGARVVDGRGKYLIPGLWDMHTHLFAEERAEVLPLYFLALSVANGVTGARDVGAMIESIGEDRQWRRAILAGDVVGPRLVLSGPMIEARSDTHLPHRLLAARTPEEARAAVDSIRAWGMDFVKVHDGGMTRDAFFAVAAEARRVGLPFGGHVPVSVPATAASDAGMRSLEHLWGAPQACTARETAFVREIAGAVPPPGYAARAAYTAYAPALAAAFDSAACAAFADRLRRNGTYVTPTLVTSRLRAHPAEARRVAADRLRYVSAALRRAWPGAAQDPAGAERARGDTLYALLRRLTGFLARAGAPVLAGTDTPTEYVVPGFALHDELALLVESGMTPLEALQAATLNPARYFGATDSSGTVAAGKAADLVLLDADPLLDIHNTARIRAVVANGRLFDRAALDALLAAVERAANPATGR